MSAQDERAIEVLALGLPLHHGAQLAVDVTLRCALTANGEAHPNAAAEDGAVCSRARVDKVRKYTAWTSLKVTSEHFGLPRTWKGEAELNRRKHVKKRCQFLRQTWFQCGPRLRNQETTVATYQNKEDERYKLARSQAWKPPV